MSEFLDLKPSPINVKLVIKHVNLFWKIAVHLAVVESIKLQIKLRENWTDIERKLEQGCFEINKRKFYIWPRSDKGELKQNYKKS